MASSFILRLDTTAPQVTWGLVDGAENGQRLTVQYLVNEPGVVSAELELVDGTRVPMTVEADHLWVDVPEGAPEGWGRVLALVRDALDNTATRSLAVYVTGVLAPTPSGPQPLPSPPQRDVPTDRVPAVESRAGVSDRFEVTVAITTTTAARVRSRYRAPDRRRVILRERVRTGTAYSLAASVASTWSAATATSETAVTKRGEGPSAEEELIFLDLL